MVLPAVIADLHLLVGLNLKSMARQTATPGVQKQQERGGKQTARKGDSPSKFTLQRMPAPMAALKVADHTRPRF